MNKFGIVCFVLAAALVVRNDAVKQLTEAQRSKIYGKLVTGAMECMNKHPLKLEHIQDFRNKKVPNDEVANCFSFCLYKKLGLMDDTGKISKERAVTEAKKIFKEGDEMLTKVDELIDGCIHVNDEKTTDGDKGCDRARLSSECFIKNSEEFGLYVKF